MSWCPETASRILALCLPSWPPTGPLCPRPAFWAFCYPRRRRRHHHLLGQSFLGDPHVPIPRAQGTLQKRRDKSKRQKTWKTQGNKTLEINKISAYMNSHRLRQRPQV